MHTAIRACAALGACTLILAVAASASANNLSVEPAGDGFRFTWPNLVFSAAGGGAETDCRIVLEGTFHREIIAKTSEEPTGGVTRAIVTESSCSGLAEDLIIHTETLPWTVRYHSFTGTLPNIASVHASLTGVEFTLSVLGGLVTCEYQGDPELDLLREEGSVITTADAEPEPDVERIGGSGLCPEELESDGNANVESLEGEELTLTLVEPQPGDLQATPSSVVVEPLEESDGFTLRNAGEVTVTVDDVRLAGVDGERPEFETSSPGCRSAIAPNASCAYTITVNDRPLREGRVVFTYDDGVNPEARTETISVEIQARLGVLVAAPRTVEVTQQEQNDIVVVRNEGFSTLTITRVVVEATDAEEPEFDASAPSCSGTLRVGESCAYVIAVNNRPEDDGSITIHYETEGESETLEIPVVIDGEDDPAELATSPTAVAVESLETNDSFVVRNVGAGTATATINEITVQATDRESPEFEVSEPGCTLTLIDGASCTYIVIVNGRPQREGYVTFDYRDGQSSDRQLRVRVDIEA